MALMQCPECGKEISDSAKKCPHCGYALISAKKVLYANKHKIFIITICVCLTLLVILAIDILSRPNIKIDDFDIGNKEFDTLLFLGIPTESNANEWIYEDCGIEFYNIPVKWASYHIWEGKYYLSFDGAYEDVLRSTMVEYCNSPDNGYFSAVYNYKKFRVTTFYGADGCGVRIEPNSLP